MIMYFNSWVPTTWNGNLFGTTNSTFGLKPCPEMNFQASRMLLKMSRIESPTVSILKLSCRPVRVTSDVHWECSLHHVAFLASQKNCHCGGEKGQVNYAWLLIISFHTKSHYKASLYKFCFRLTHQTKSSGRLSDYLSGEQKHRPNMVKLSSFCSESTLESLSL